MKRILSFPPIAFILDVADACDRAGTARSAAALSYFLVLTLFPLLVWVNFFLTLFRADLVESLERLGQLMPAGVLSVVEDYLSYAAATQSPALLAACLITILLSASAGMRTIFVTLEDLCQVPRWSGPRRIVLSVALSLLFLLTIYLSALVVFTGDWFFTVLAENLSEPWAALLPLDALSQLWEQVRYLLLFCFVLLLVLLAYGTGLPRGTIPTGILLCSALLSAGAMVVASAVFSWFIGMSSRYALVYGSLASLIILLAWLYFCGNILLLGAAVGWVWTGRRRKKHRSAHKETQ